MPDKIILIISTDATRTGTPILLLNNIKWLKKNSDLKFILLLRTGGELLEEYRSLVEVFIWDSQMVSNLPDNKLVRFATRIYKKIFAAGKQDQAHDLSEMLKRRYEIQLIYSNSARNGDILSFFTKDVNCKILTHVHEGEKTLNLWNVGGHVSYNLEVSHELIAVSASVKKTLEEKFNVTKNITVIPGAIETDHIKHAKNRDILNEYNINGNPAIIMSCGWLGWHKGTDFFIQIARILLQQYKRPLHFIWVGGSESDEVYHQLQFDINKLGLTEHISLITSKPNVRDYLDLADIFLMLSREESFSLVTVEAGLLNKPVLCFEGSGGPCEIVDFDKRFMVPFADINQMSDRIIDLLENHIEREGMGKFLYNRVVENYTIEKNTRKLLSVIEDIAKE